MKIIVCVKQIDLIYARTGVDPANHFISEEDRIRMVNPYDELAVEEAIRIKETLKQGQVTLVTLGNLLAEKALQRCLAMGADRLIQVNDPSFVSLDPWGSSVVLAKAMERLEPDLILCGKEASDDNGGQVGAYVSELLGFPYISCVVKVDFSAEGRKARVHRALGKGDKEVVESEIPLLLSAEKGLNEPRYPTLPNLLRALNQETECWDREFLGLETSDFRPMAEVVQVDSPRPRSKSVAVPDSHLNGFERVLWLLSGSRTEKKGSVLEGPPQAMASEIVRFLIENGIIEA